MSLKNIFESITPDNIKTIPLVRDAMDIFIANLEENSSWSIDITELYKSENVEVQEAFFKTYLAALYKVITEAQSNPLIIEKLDGYESPTGSIPLRRAITDILNSEYLTTNKIIKQKNGIEPIIEYTYNLGKYLQDNERNAKDFSFKDVQPFYFQVEGSLFQEVYENIVKPLSHPIGWCYSYLHVLTESLIDYFGVNGNVKFNTIEIVCLSGNFAIFSPESTIDPVKEEFLSRTNPETGYPYSDLDDPDTWFDNHVRVYLDKNPSDFDISFINDVRVVTIYFDDGSVLYQDANNDVYYDDENSVRTDFPDQCSIKLSYDTSYTIEYTDEIDIQMWTYFNEDGPEGVDLQGIIEYGEGTELKDPFVLYRIPSNAVYFYTEDGKYFTTPEPTPNWEGAYLITDLNEDFEASFDNQSDPTARRGWYVYASHVEDLPTQIASSFFVQDNAIVVTLDTVMANNGTLNYAPENHVLTQWQIGTSPLFEPETLLFNESSGTNLYTIDAFNLPVNIDLFAQCRQVFDDGNMSSWSPYTEIDFGYTYMIPFFDADYIQVQYTFPDGDDIDTRTKVLTIADSPYIGWAWDGDNDGLINFAGDNTGTGFESTYIDLNVFKTLYPTENNIKIDVRAQWFGTVGVEPVSIKLFLYKGGSMVDSGYTWTNPSATDMLELDFTSLVLDTYSGFDFSIGRRIGVVNYNLISKTGFFDPLDSIAYGTQTSQTPGVSFLANNNGTVYEPIAVKEESSKVIVTTDATTRYVSNGTYNGLTTQTSPTTVVQITTGNPDTETAYDVPVPWQVQFLGTTYDYFHMDDNAMITFSDVVGGGTANSYPEINSPNRDKIVLIGGADSSVRSIKYEIQGTAPNRTLHIWWEGYVDVTGEGSDPRGFEPWLSETDLTNIPPTAEFEIILFENMINKIEVLTKTDEVALLASDYDVWAAQEGITPA